MTTINETLVNQWQYIPEQAFLYFPQGSQIREAKVGQQQKQWRKIFQNGQQYEKFELSELDKLQQQLNKKSINLDPWFDRPNKLRFLQANKFKTSNAIESMEETTKWRAAEYPIKTDDKIMNMLNSGAFYFCGRDSKYRPIIVADIGKFNSEQVDLIPKTLVLIMEFMIDNLMIPGQVENYVLIMNLQQASFGLRSVIMKILSFTSNSYRGRLFASYLLSMPTIIKWGWNGIISKVVSQNTVKKIKISGQMTHEDMWTHISKQIIEEQYGGNLPNIQNSYWPPNKQLLLFVDRSKDKENGLISPEDYRRLFEQGSLNGRKVLKKYVHRQMAKQIQQEVHFIKQPKHAVESKKLNVEYQQQKPLRKESPVSNIKESNINISLNEPSKGTFMIRTQTPFIQGYHSIKTFFQTPQFQKICGATASH